MYRNNVYDMVLLTIIAFEASLMLALNAKFDGNWELLIEGLIDKYFFLICNICLNIKQINVIINRNISIKRITLCSV